MTPAVGRTDLSVPAPLARQRLVSDRAVLAWALGLSVFLHFALVWQLTFARGFTLADRGEDGSEGGGGATFEVTVRGPEEDVPSPFPMEAAPPSTTNDTPDRPTPAARPIARVLPRETDGTEVAPALAPSATTDDGASAASPSIAAAGTGDDVTDPGRLRGRDDARIRALLAGSVGGGLGGSSLGDVTLLAEASRCPDPVAGTWTAHRYSPEFRDWARFTLSIAREGDDLRGTIRTRMWRGLPSDTRPPPCGPGGWDYTVEMRAHGTVHGEHFDFGALEHHIAHVECASPTFGYNPDHFSGTYDVERDMLRTLNNDGGRDVDAAYTFRRSSCQP